MGNQVQRKVKGGDGTNDPQRLAKGDGKAIGSAGNAIHRNLLTVETAADVGRFGKGRDRPLHFTLSCRDRLTRFEGNLGCELSGMIAHQAGCSLEHIRSLEGRGLPPGGFKRGRRSRDRDLQLLCRRQMQPCERLTCKGINNGMDASASDISPSTPEKPLLHEFTVTVLPV